MRTLFRRRILPMLLALMLMLQCMGIPALAEEAVISEPAVAEETLPAEPETLPPETSGQIPETEETAPTEEPLPPRTTEPEETIPAETAELAAAQPEPHGPGIYFGQLHAHSSLSDGTLPPEAVFSAAALAGMDFLALTDHGDSLSDADWAAGKAAAEAASGTGFVGLFGYEMNWPARMQIGHITAFHTPSFTDWQAGFDAFDGALERYYAAMAATPGAIGQFSHPGTQYGTFCDFSAYSGAADGFMQLLETDGSVTQYISALDQGWHVAPTWACGARDGRFDTGRTAVSVDSLTEEGIYAALGSCRVYATADPDLEIQFTLEGHPMGSTAEDRQLGETADLTVTFRDPTDSAVGLVEVLADGGAVLADAALYTGSGTLEFSLPLGYRYYFLRVTQPDGDIALTAPVWVSHREELGISALTCETAVPVSGEEITLKLELYNREKTDFLVDSLEILADGQLIFTDTGLSGIPADSDMTHTITLCCDALGQTTLTARLRGTLNGEVRLYEASVTLSFRQASQVTDIVVTGSAAREALDELKALAAEADIRVIMAEELSAGVLETCRILVVSPGETQFSEEFLEQISDFGACGGSVIVCGRADTGDGETHAAFQLNRVLSALGSSLRLRDDVLRDTVTNGGSREELYPDAFNTDADWCEAISRDQVYRLVSGCSVDVGSGQWLVKTRSTTRAEDGDGDGLGGSAEEAPAVLACEALISGGTVFTAGSLFLADDCLSPPANSWEEPYANRTIVRRILDLGSETQPLSTVAQARSGEAGELLRIRGYVTAGTANPYNTFPDTLYLQDDTGGIAVVPFSGEGIRVGMPVEIVGYADVRQGNRILRPVSWEVLDAALYQYQPRTGAWSSLLDADTNGGRLVEVEGECIALSHREDATISGILLKNKSGQTAKVLIEDTIFSGATGKNRLHETICEDRTVRAAGILHIRDSGETVIRVRNCDEVVYVPPETYLNPKTGDALPLMTAAMAASGAMLAVLKRKKNR